MALKTATETRSGCSIAGESWRGASNGNA